MRSRPLLIALSVCALSLTLTLDYAHAATKGKKKINPVLPPNSQVVEQGGKLCALVNGKYVPARRKGDKIFDAGLEKKALAQKKKAAIAAGKSITKISKAIKTVSTYIKSAAPICAEVTINPPPPTPTPGAEATPTPNVPSGLECESMEQYAGSFGDAEKVYLLTKFGFGLGTKEQNLFMGQPTLAGFVDTFTSYRPEDQGFQSSADALAASNYAQRTNDAIFLSYLNTNNPGHFRALEALQSINTTGADVLPANGDGPALWYKHARDVLLEAAKTNESIFSMVKRSAVHPMMLIYLDNAVSTRLNPNENYARELQELFTLGVTCSDGAANYTETRPSGDVLNAARVLTGYSVVLTNGIYESRFSNATHDSTPRLMYAGTPHAFFASNLDELIAGIQNHPCSGELYAKRLLNAFLTEEPPVGLIRNFAAAMKAKDFRIMDSINTLMKSKAAFCPAYRNSVTPKPDAFIARMVRTMNLRDSVNSNMNNVTTLVDATENAGFSINYPETVFYYKPNVFRTPQSALEALNAMADLIQIAINTNGTLFSTAQILPAAANANSNDTVAHVAARLGLTLTPELQAVLTHYLDHIKNSNGTKTRRIYVNSQHALEKGVPLYMIMAPLVYMQ